MDNQGSERMWELPEAKGVGAEPRPARPISLYTAQNGRAPSVKPTLVPLLLLVIALF